MGLTKKDYNLIKHKGYITKMTKEATTPTKKKRTTRKTTKKTKVENKAAMDITTQPITPNEDPSQNQIEVKEDKPKEFNLNDYPKYTQTRYNVLLDRYMRQNHLFAEAHSLALRDLKLQKLI